MAENEQIRIGLSIVSDAGTRKTLADLADVRKRINELKNEFKSGGKDVDTFTSELSALEKQAKSLDKALDEVGEKRRIDIDSGELQEAPARTGGNAPSANKFRGAASLIGGGEVVGLIDDFQDLGEGLGALSGNIGQSATAALSAGVAFGVATAAIAVIGAALKSFADEQQRAADTINALVDQQRSVSQRVIEGATSEELQSRLAELNALRDDENARLAELKQNYQENVDSAGLLAPAVKVLSGAEDGLAGQIDKSTKLAQDYDAEIKAINEALASGKVSANDAKAAEKALASVRSTDTTKATASAANQEKEAARAREKAAEEAARAAEKAAAEAERNAERAQAAQDKYNNSVKDAGRQFRESATDIGTNLKQGLTDNLTSLLRDGTDIAAKYQRETVDLNIKASRDERDALTEHLRDIEDIRADAQQSEQEAIREGDFKQLFLAREAAQKALRDEQKQTSRENEDRLRTLNDERSDLLTNAQRERSDRLTAFARQNEDTRLAADRDFVQAKLAKQRSLAMSQEAYNAELKQFGAYLQARQQLQGQMLQPGKTTSTGATLPAGQFAVPVQAMFAQVLRK